jgi:predicted RNase H-like HicB family nuclease
MKTKTKEFSVLIERDAEGYFVASVPALRGCHTQAKSLDKLMERVREAIGYRPSGEYLPMLPEFQALIGDMTHGIEPQTVGSNDTKCSSAASVEEQERNRQAILRHLNPMIRGESK